MDDVVHLAERQHGVAGLVAQHVVHGARPVHAPARHVPVPQAAPPAHQRHVDALVRLDVDAVGALRPRRLAEIGVEDDDEHARGQDEQRDVERQGPAPFGKDRVPRNKRRRCDAAGFCEHDGRIPVLAAYIDVHDAGPVAEQEEGLSARHDVVQGAPFPSHRPRRDRQHLELAVRQRQHLICAERAPARDVVEQGLLVAARVGRRQRELTGGERQHGLGVALDLVMPVHQRKDAQCGDDDQENDDQRGNELSEQGLGRQQPAIGRFGDEARVAGKSVSAPRRAAFGKNDPAGRAPRVRLGHQWLSPKHLSRLTIRQRRTSESTVKNQR